MRSWSKREIGERLPDPADDYHPSPCSVTPLLLQDVDQIAKVVVVTPRRLTDTCAGHPEARGATPPRSLSRSRRALRPLAMSRAPILIERVAGSPQPKAEIELFEAEEELGVEHTDITYRSHTIDREPVPPM